jgi:hypothetical protein
MIRFVAAVLIQQRSKRNLERLSTNEQGIIRSNLRDSSRAATTRTGMTKVGPAPGSMTLHNLNLLTGHHTKCAVASR